jgi:hypothetical protein
MPHTACLSLQFQVQVRVHWIMAAQPSFNVCFIESRATCSRCHDDPLDLENMQIKTDKRWPIAAWACAVSVLTTAKKWVM